MLSDSRLELKYKKAVFTDKTLNCFIFIVEIVEFVQIMHFKISTSGVVDLYSVGSNSLKFKISKTRD